MNARGIEREARESEGPSPNGEEPGDAVGGTRPEEPSPPPAQPQEGTSADDWQHLKGYGYAPGGYMSRCHVCGATPGMDKRAITCRPCAEAMHAKAAATPPQPAQPATADERADAIRFRWLCEHPDWHFIERLCREFAADSSSEFLAGLRRVIDARRAVELDPFEEHQPAQPATGQQELTDAFERALKQTWQMVDPAHPPGAPGSYARGEHNGIVAALQTMRENFTRALAAHPGRQVPAEPDALRMFIGAAYPVSTDIDPRGYRWCEAYLDQALAQAGKEPT